jgi:hypothetical protein
MFFKSFRKYISEEYNSSYSHSGTSVNFLKQLQDRRNDNDIILITAHGDEKSIVGESIRGQDQLLPFESLSDLKNSFVFAFSCSTAKLGERICEEHEAISYLGFNDDIALVVKSDSYQTELSIILKQIYIKALTNSFNRFLKIGLQVKQFALTISKNLVEEHAKIIRMSSEEMIQTFKISRRVGENKLFRLKLQNELLNTINTVSDRIEISGEGWFVPWYYIDQVPLKQLEKLQCELKKAKVENEAHRFYYYIIMAVVSAKIGDLEESDYYKGLIEKIGREVAIDFEALLRTS